MSRGGLRWIATLALAGALAACGTAVAPLVEANVATVDLARLPPIELPQDQAPHANLTEWWYFTGHLDDQAGAAYGFEFVIFQSARRNAPTGYAAHFALTDKRSRDFKFDQRTATHGVAGDGLNLCVGGWSLQWRDGAFVIAADLPEGLLNLELQPQKPAVLQNQDGVLDFLPYGWSYYYSYTRLQVRGTLQTDGVERTVTGTAWMDHQWGDFVMLVAGGWDWFSVQLDDGRDLMATLIRDETGAVVDTYGTLVDGAGRSTHLTAADLQASALGSWTSPASGAVYPSGWRVAVPGAGLDLTLTPVVRNQELDTRASAGLFYWEGAVQAHTAGDVVGRGYVELTGYATPAAPEFAPSVTPGLSTCGGPAT